MSNLLYGGISYPNTAFVFDRTYNNFKEALEEANKKETITIITPEEEKEEGHIGYGDIVIEPGDDIPEEEPEIPVQTIEKFVGDGVLLNRYVLVTYCSDALPQSVKHSIELYAWGGSKPDGYDANEAWQLYKTNYEIDNAEFLNAEIKVRAKGKSYDRHVLRKRYDTTEQKFYYEDVASLNTTLDTETLKLVDIKGNDTILSIENGLLYSSLSIQYNEEKKEIQLFGKNLTAPISTIDVTDFIADGIFQEINFNDEENAITFKWTTYDYITNETAEHSYTLNLLDIFDPYINGPGIIVDSLPNENPTISIKIDNNSETFLTVDEQGLKLSGVNEAILNAKTEAITATENTVKIVTSETEKDVGKNVGDICIVKTLIGNSDKISYTAYVWQQKIGETEAHWEAMDGNYNAENVYFGEDIVITTQVGNIDLTNGQGKIPAQGKNLKQIFESLWTKEDLELSITNPTISLTVSGNISGEVGETFPRPTATIAVTGTGSYEYGSKDAEGNVYSRDDGTGIVFDWLKVGYGTSSEEALDSASAYTNTGTSISYTAKNTDISVAKFTDTEQTYYFWGQGSYPDAVHRPVTNLGNFIDNKGLPTTEYSEGQQYIKGTVLELGGSNKATWKATGYRNWYIYVGNDLSTINSNFIRGCTSKGNAKNANDISLDVAKGTKRVMIALPTGNLTENSTTITGYNKRLKSCIDVGGMGLDIFNADPSKFVQSVVSVADASGQNNMDYIVYVYENVNGLAATTLNVDIG